MNRFAKPLILLCAVVLLGPGCVPFKKQPSPPPPEGETILTFDDCVAAGKPVQESYPRKCMNGPVTFVENVGNAVEKMDVIRLDGRMANQKVTSPLVVTGEARGYWFFENVFPVILKDQNGTVLAQGLAQAQAEWMTENFVRFAATLEFEQPGPEITHGTLVLQKDNPSGMPENDDALEIPIRF